MVVGFELKTFQVHPKQWAAARAPTSAMGVEDTDINGEKPAHNLTA